MAKMVRLDKVKGYPVTFKNGLGSTLENGLFLELKGLADDYEAYNVALAGATPTGTVVLHASVEMMYDEKKLEDATKPKVKPGRFASIDMNPRYIGLSVCDYDASGNQTGETHTSDTLYELLKSYPFKTSIYFGADEYVGTPIVIPQNSNAVVKI